MNIELVPRKLGELIPFGVATCDHLEKDNSADFQHFTTVGNIFADGNLAWLFNERSLEVVSTRNGWRHAVHEFGSDIKELSVVVNCITELQLTTGWKLIVGTDCGSSGGLLCVFDVKTSKVIKAVTFPRPITAVEVVSKSGGANAHNWMLANELRYMYGIAAVGTQDGPVYLVDLELDEYFSFSDESSPGLLVFVGKGSCDIAGTRVECLGRNRFMAMFLNDGCRVRDEFHYQSANCSELDIISGDVLVTSLHFIYQAGILAIGFNFGGFQLWNMNTLTLQHTGSCDDSSLALVSFAFQEPENDPRNYCYLWVVHGHSDSDYTPSDPTVATLFSLAFNEKVFVKGVGFGYQEMVCCQQRFEWALTVEPSHSMSTSPVAGSRLVCCSAVDEGYAGHRRCPDGAAEVSSVNDDDGKSLCVFAWETFFKNASIGPRMSLAIFDINRWYQAEMPSRPRHHSGMCPYLGFFSMTDICEKILPDNLLALCVRSKSIARPFALSPSEKLFYPSFLGFDVVALIGTGVTHAVYMGLQRQVLHDVHQRGPSVLLDPSDTFNMLVYSAIIPLPGEPNIAGLTLNGQREAILSMALEHNLIEFLVLCITDWAAGNNVNDVCNLRFFQEWAWKRVCFIKTYVDRQCAVLYDCSCLQLETSVIGCLHARAAQLKHLESLFQTLLAQSVSTTDQGIRELQSKATVISLLAKHLEVVLWFLNCGLLPENVEPDNGETDDRLAYPKSLLTQAYASRRGEVQNINSTIGPTDLLLIDGLMSNIGEPITALWEKEGGDGMYPPPSFHALLNIYLLDGIAKSAMHQLVHLVYRLVKFPAAFSLSPSLTKLTQGFWLLDHGDFEEAFSVLLHPIISSRDIAVWQHRRIMKAFLYQGEFKKALRYAQVKQPPNETPEDLKFLLTLLIANGLVTKAFSYQREIRSQSNAKEILNHFFVGCQQTKNFRGLLQLPFSPFEEQALEAFMLSNSDKKCQELLVIHFLQLSRYVDAKRLNDQLMNSATFVSDPASRERNVTRNAIVEGFFKLMPDVVKRVSHNAFSVYAAGKPAVQYVDRPQPLSTHVNSTASADPTTNSTFVTCVMQTVSEIWSHRPDDYTPFNRKKGPQQTPFEAIPFVCTPVTPRVKQADFRLSNPVFPIIVSKDNDAVPNDQCVYQGSPSKKPRFLDVSPARHSGSAKRRSLMYYNAEALSLLQTPPVRRKTPAVRLSLNDIASTSSTPQSILKARSSSVDAKPVQENKIEQMECTDRPVSPDHNTMQPCDAGTDVTLPEPVKQLRFRSHDSFEEDDRSTSDSRSLPSIVGHSPDSNNKDSNKMRTVHVLTRTEEMHHDDTFEMEVDAGESDSEAICENVRQHNDDEGGRQVGLEDNVVGQRAVPGSLEKTDNDPCSSNSSADVSFVISNTSSPVKSIGDEMVTGREEDSLSIGEDEGDETKSYPSDSAGEEEETSATTPESETHARKAETHGLSMFLSPRVPISAGLLIQKCLEMRSKVMEDMQKSGMVEDGIGAPTLKNLVDNTVESSLASPITFKGPHASSFLPSIMPQRTSPRTRRLVHSDAAASRGGVDLKDSVTVASDADTPSPEEELKPSRTSQVKTRSSVSSAQNKVPSPRTRSEAQKATPALQRGAKKVPAASVRKAATVPAEDNYESSHGKPLPGGSSGIDGGDRKADVRAPKPIEKSSKLLPSDGPVVRASTSRPSSRMSTRSSVAESSSDYSPSSLSNASDGRVLRSRTVLLSASGSPESVEQKSPSKSPPRSRKVEKQTKKTGETMSTGSKFSGAKSKAANQTPDSGIAALASNDRSSSAARKKRIAAASSLTFSFSQPTIVAADDVVENLANNTPSTPTTTSFIFSPPLTRSRSRRSRRDVDSNESQSDADSIYLPAPAIHEATDMKISRFHRRRSSRSAGTLQLSDSIISFTSPILEEGMEQEEATKSKRRAARQSTPVPKSKSLLPSRRSTRLE